MPLFIIHSIIMVLNRGLLFTSIQCMMTIKHGLDKDVYIFIVTIQIDRWIYGWKGGKIEG